MYLPVMDQKSTSIGYDERQLEERRSSGDEWIPDFRRSERRRMAEVKLPSLTTLNQDERDVELVEGELTRVVSSKYR